MTRCVCLLVRKTLYIKTIALLAGVLIGLLSAGLDETESTRYVGHHAVYCSSPG
jgi:hypothetical protein